MDTHKKGSGIETEHSIEDLRNNIKWPNKCISGVPEKEKIRNNENKISSDIMAIDLPELMEEINPFHTCEKKMITATCF